MKKLVPTLAVWLPCFVGAAALLGGACSKKEPPAEAPRNTASDPAAKVEPKQGPMAAAGDPSKLPAAGTAPASVQVGKELDAMWDVKIKTLQGKDAKLADFKGKALLIVNVASKCGLTPQYETLEALQKKYQPQGFTVVGFPCNQFGGQEPGSAQEIQEFCSSTYGVTFPMMEKVEVNGPGRHPIYQALTPLKDGSGHTGDIRWNFEKFVVSADGTQITRFSPKTKPDDPAVIAAVEAALPKK
jgi:glutathione peroxidase